MGVSEGFLKSVSKGFKKGIKELHRVPGGSGSGFQMFQEAFKKISDELQGDFRSF